MVVVQTSHSPNKLFQLEALDKIFGNFRNFSGKFPEIFGNLQPYVQIVNLLAQNTL